MPPGGCWVWKTLGEIDQGSTDDLQEEVYNKRPKQRECAKSQEDDLPRREGTSVIADQPGDEAIEDGCDHIENDAVALISLKSEQRSINLTYFSLVALQVYTTSRSTW